MSLNVCAHLPFKNKQANQILKKKNASPRLSYFSASSFADLSFLWMWQVTCIWTPGQLLLFIWLLLLFKSFSVIFASAPALQTSSRYRLPRDCSVFFIWLASVFFFSFPNSWLEISDLLGSPFYLSLSSPSSCFIFPSGFIIWKSVKVASMTQHLISSGHCQLNLVTLRSNDWAKWITITYSAALVCEVYFQWGENLPHYLGRR